MARNADGIRRLYRRLRRLPHPVDRRVDRVVVEDPLAADADVTVEDGRMPDRLGDVLSVHDGQASG